ncbi:MAG: hypothetical protein MUC96_24475 [Myxococcaceae bacterium]|nr:hypothetical protein [Myxococcaceae bacterium]
MSRSVLPSGLAVALLLLGCPREAPEVRSSDVGDASVDAGPVDAGPPAPLAFRLEFTLSDGGVAVFDEFDAGVVVEPARVVELSAPVALEGARVRLLDWTDSVVPSDDVLETSDAGFRYRIELVQPLKPGRSYAVLVDSESADRVTDLLGRDFDEWRLAFRVAGEVQPEPGQASKKSKKIRR